VTLSLSVSILIGIVTTSEQAAELEQSYQSKDDGELKYNLVDWLDRIGVIYRVNLMRRDELLDKVK
jgi:hypothetical protein